MDLNDGMGRQPGIEADIDTTVVLPHARRIEKITGGAGARMRQLAEAYSLAAHSANKDPRNTWFSPTNPNVSTLIDYIFTHEDAHILSAGPLYQLGKCMQYIPIARLADHVPVHLRVQLPQHRPSTSRLDHEHIKWNKNLLMKELVYGQNREDFIAQIERDMETFLHQQSTLDALEQNTPDDYFDLLNQAITTTSAAYFGEKAKPFGAHYETLKRVKAHLLNARNTLKTTLANNNPDTDMVSLLDAIKANDRQMQCARKEHYNLMADIYIGEVHEAWRRRDAYGANQYMRLAAGSKFGTKKKDYRTVQQSLPTREDWKELLQQPGAQGGMLAHVENWDQMRQEHQEEAQPLPMQSLNYWTQGGEDTKKLTEYVIHTSKRKAVPKGSVPTEILAMTLAPNHRRNCTPHICATSETKSTTHKQDITFVAATSTETIIDKDTTNAAETITKLWETSSKPTSKKRITAPRLREAITKGHAHINRTGYTPLRWHKSQGTSISKNNGKKKAKGYRLIHILDTMGKGFFAKKHHLHPLSHNDTGFAKHRRREYAVLTQNMNNWKLKRLKLNFINNNHDCTNAFCCTDLETCDKVCHEIMSNDTDAELAKQRHRWSSMTVMASEDMHDPANQLFMRPRQGNLQGDTQAVHSFPRAFQDITGPWNFSHVYMYQKYEGSGNADHAICYTMCPQTGKHVDTSLTKYADDITKTVIGPETLTDTANLEGLLRRAEASSLELSESLDRHSYAQNTDKLMGIIGLNGKGAHVNTRRIQSGLTQASYTLQDHARSLGSLVAADGSFKFEKHARADAVKKARFQLGKRITMPTIPYRLRRTLLIGHIQNTAISGLEAYALTQGDYAFLDGLVTGVYRSAMGKKAYTFEKNPNTGVPEVKKTISNAAVRKYWKLPSVQTELRIRRITMYKTMAAHPLDSVLPMAAAFGQMRAEQQRGMAAPINNDNITETATPWAKQFQDDILKWAAHNAEVQNILAEVQNRVFSLFTHPEVQRRLLEIDHKDMRDQENSAEIPPPEHHESTQEKTARRNTYVTQPYQCTNCPMRFETLQQQRAHEAAAHQIKNLSTAVTPTNYCMICHTIFADRPSAITHVERTLNRGYCKPQQSRNLRDIQQPTTLTCLYCTITKPEEVPQPFEDLAALHQHIRTEHLPDLRDHGGTRHADVEQTHQRRRRTRKWRRARETQQSSHEGREAHTVAHGSREAVTDSGKGTKRSRQHSNQDDTDSGRQPPRQGWHRGAGALAGTSRTECRTISGLSACASGASHDVGTHENSGCQDTGGQTTTGRTEAMVEEGSAWSRRRCEPRADQDLQDNHSQDQVETVVKEREGQEGIEHSRTRGLRQVRVLSRGQECGEEPLQAADTGRRSTKDRTSASEQGSQDHQGPSQGSGVDEEEAERKRIAGQAPNGASCVQLETNTTVQAPKGASCVQLKESLIPLSMDMGETFPDIGDAEECLDDYMQLSHAEDLPPDNGDAEEIVTEAYACREKNKSRLACTERGRTFLAILDADDAPPYASRVKRMLEAQCGKPHKYGIQTSHARLKLRQHCWNNTAEAILLGPTPTLQKTETSTSSDNKTYTQPKVVTQRNYELITKSRVYMKLRKSGVVPKIITDNKTIKTLVHPPKRLTKRLTGKQPDPRNNNPLRRPEGQATW